MAPIKADYLHVKSRKDSAKYAIGIQAHIWTLISNHNDKNWPQIKLLKKYFNNELILLLNLYKIIKFICFIIEKLYNALIGWCVQRIVSVHSTLAEMFCKLLTLCMEACRHCVDSWWSSPARKNKYNYYYNNLDCFRNMWTTVIKIKQSIISISNKSKLCQNHVFFYSLPTPNSIVTFIAWLCTFIWWFLYSVSFI